MKVSIGSDHAGFDLKSELIKYLGSKGIQVIDKGCYSNDRADYPDHGHAVANAVASGECNFGIVICGSGNGINMSVNKHKGVRSALCWMPEIAALAKQHNNANVIALPARYLSTEEAIACLNAFMNAEFEGGRHQGRIDKIDAC
ncbi:MAG TPA: ribose 5-phosphate isomerase B [Bacteroidia bacterium]|nr:ribose 5-phosphate isomerase B [Bacteroidia bacterium]